MYINERINQVVRVKCSEDRSPFLRLDMNENPEGLPEEFVKEVRERIDGQLLASYPNKARLIEMLAKQEGVRRENISLTCGSDEAIRYIFEVFTKPGSRALMVAPSFEMYRIYSEIFGVALERIPYDASFSLPFEKLKGRITKDISLLALFNPNSPIGEAYTPAELQELLELCRKTDTLTVIDEAYYPFGVSSAVGMLKEHAHLIVLRTFSKLYSMAGLRVGYALGSAELIRCLDNAQSTYNVNSVGILFAEELLRRPDITKRLIEEEAKGRHYLLERLEQTGYEAYAKGGNYVLVKTKRAPEDTAARLRERHILIKYYSTGILKDWIRVTTGSRKVMEQFWKEFLKCDS